MEKNKTGIITLLLVILLVLAVVNSLTTHFTIKKATRRLEHSLEYIDSAMKDIVSSRAEIDSLGNSMKKFGNYIRDVQGRVEYIDLQYRLKENTFQQYRDSILKRIRRLKADIDLTGESLPEIRVDTLNNK